MVGLKITTRRGETIEISFGHGREAIAQAEAEAARLCSANRHVATATVTGKLDY